ncbi:MAG: hypothetical protein ACLTYN_11675 [Dysosmobacter welbionis]
MYTCSRGSHNPSQITCGTHAWQWPSRQPAAGGPAAVSPVSPYDTWRGHRHPGEMSLKGWRHL